MRAILLSAGFGTRLRPLTNSVPKCLVPIRGRALLDIWIARLQQAKVGPFLVNTHYLSGKVEKHVRNSWYCNDVTLAHEHELQGTAGTLIANSSFYNDDDGLLIHADNYCMADLSEFIRQHKLRPKECDLTMMAFRTDAPKDCGILLLNERGVVIEFHEKVSNPPSNLANGAVYLLSQQAVSEICAKLPYATDFSTEVIPHFLGRIYVYETDQTFIDIGAPEAYAKACDGND